MSKLNHNFYIVANKDIIQMLLDNPINLDSTSPALAGKLLLDRQLYDVYYCPSWLKTEMLVVTKKKVLRLQLKKSDKEIK